MQDHSSIRNTIPTDWQNSHLIEHLRWRVCQCEVSSNFRPVDANCFPTNIVDHEQHDVSLFGLSCSNGIGRKYHG